MSWLFYLIISTVVLMLLSYFSLGLYVDGWMTAFIAALMISVVNILVKPVVTLLTLPINVLTLGLFSFVINAFMFMLAAWIVPGFEVPGFISALVASLLFGLLTGLIGSRVATTA